MKKNLFSFLLTSAVVLFCTLPMVSVAQTTGDYRTNSAVTFASATNWQRYNGTAWIAATNAPTSADGKILIMGPHTAQVTANVTLDQVIVDGTLQVNNGATLTLANGTGNDLFVRNRLFFQATGVIAGAGQLVLGNQAVVQTANVSGLAASITSTNPTLTAGASYWFNGATAQSTGFTGFASFGNPLHFHFKNTAGITIDRNLTITGTLTANNNVPITMGASVTAFTANAIYNGGSFNNCVGAAITPAFTDAGWASPKGIYQSPDSTEPITEASNIWTNSHKTTAHIYWLKSGSGNNRIVILKAGSPVNVNAAIDNTTYTANAAFGSGTAIDGGFVVYNGAGSQVNVTGLIEGTTYHVAVFEYNQDCSGNRNYKTGTPLITSFVTAERPFIMEWITTDGTLTIPTTGTGYNYTVSYRILPAGMPTVLTGQTGNVTLTGLTNGVTYEISITGAFSRIYFPSTPATNFAKIRNIRQWGSVQWTSMEYAFGTNSISPYTGCASLMSNAADVPNLNNVTSLREMFFGCSIFNGSNIGSWNTQNVTTISGMFSYGGAFNQDIGNWNTQNVRDMKNTLSGTNFNQNIGSWNIQNVNTISFMFAGASAFNQNIGTWNTQNITDMNNLFGGTLFNQNIGSWNTQNVTIMASMFGGTPFNQNIGSWNTQNVLVTTSMFYRATAFNQNIGNWNTQNITRMDGMFEGATAFNQNIGNWNTQNVVSMYIMFRSATAFNQSLANWDVTSIFHDQNITNMSMLYMLDNCGINRANYDATLIGWATQNVKTGLQLASTGLKYCSGQTARNSLIINKNWIITGDALLCPASIAGNIFADINNNCTKEIGEINLKSLVVKVTPGNIYGMTETNGNYKIGVPTIGTYQVELLPQVPIGSTNTITAVCPPKTVPVTAVTPNVTNIDFGAKGKICSQLIVNVSIDRFRRCFEGNTYIKYKNVGLLDANTVTVKVELPVDIQAVSSVPAWTSQVGNILTYNISTIAGQGEGIINLKHKVVCGNEAIRGQARCIKATISPSSYCLPTVSPTWDNADLVAKDTCINRKLGRFIIKNVGTGNMADSTNYRIFFDNVIVRTGKVKLLANQEFLIDINNTTQVLRIEVEQTPFHPTGVPAMRFFNRCGAVALSVAPIVQLPNLTNIAEGSACATILDSYDPNDKQIIPSGVTAQKIVEKDQEVEFQVRFQNEGNDEAYKVVVRDTLDLNLDVATIRTISTSHTGTVSMEGVGQGVVIWTFENINLPAKSVDEVGSNGMITFRIRMNPNLAIGTVIKNKAAIYFDFNSPIITNETLIRIGVLPTDFGNPVHVNTIFPCPTLPSVAVAGANQNINTTNTTLAATPIVKGYGQWRIVQGTGTFSDEFSPTATVTNLSFGLNIFEWKSYLCNNTSSNQVQVFVCPTITISPNSLSNAAVGTNYSQILTQVGGIGAITYSISAGTLPNGLTLNSTTGEISGIATVANTFTFTVQAQDVNNCLGTKVYSIQTVCPTITLAPANLNNATVGTNYSQTLTQVGGIGAITYSISAGTLPNGLTLNATTGEISGVATVANTFNFTVQAKDVNNCLGTKVYAIQTVCPTITISPANLNNATVGTNYSQTLTQVGGIGAINYTISAGTLPNGLTLNATTGEISGVATVANTFNFTVQAKDVNNCLGTKAYSIQTICPTITLAPANLSNATLGTNYSQTLTQVGGIGAITYSISAGTLPNGLTLNSTTGEISGIATVANTFNFTVQAQDVNNCLGTRAYSIQTVCPTITISPNSLSNATVGTNYSQTLTQVGGIGAISYSISAGTLPNGLTLNATTGEISGIATVANTFNFTVQAQDVNNCTGTKAYTIIVGAAVILPPPPVRSNQTITFDDIPNRIFSNQLVELLARASSGLPVSFEVVSGNGVLAGQNFVTLTGLGLITVRASQAGNSQFLAAEPVTKTFTVIATSQTLTGFETIADRAWNSNSFLINAVTNSNLPINFAITEGANIAEIINGNIVKLKPAIGKVTITATQAGNTTTNAATPIIRSFNVIKADQNISSIVTLPTLIFRPNLTQTLSASATSELPVIASIVSGNATITNNVISFTSAGSVVVRYSQAGNDLWNPAISVERTFVVEKATQNITLISAPNEVIIGTPQTVIASATSGLPVMMRVISGTATVNGLVVTATDGENIVIELNQAGDANYNAAIPVRFSIGINPTLTLTSVSGTKFCGGAVITVNFAVTGLFLGNNRMAAYLSDANGVFGNDRQLIGTVDARNSGVITGLIPANIPSGRGYKVRLEATSPRIFSIASTQTLELNAVPEVATISQDGAALIANVSSVATGVQWFANGVVISGATSQKFTPTKAQSDANNLYSVVISNANGCTSVSGFATYQPLVVTGIDEPTLSAKLAIYPNPTAEKFVIELGLEKLSKVAIKLTDASGKVVLTDSVEPNSLNFKHNINIADYASGVYMLMITIDGKTAVKRVVKQ